MATSGFLHAFDDEAQLSLQTHALPLLLQFVGGPAELAALAERRLQLGEMRAIFATALGALLTGMAVRWTGQPVTWVFGVLALVFALGAALVLWMPETVTPRAGALASLVIAALARRIR